MRVERAERERHRADRERQCRHRRETQEHHEWRDLEQGIRESRQQKAQHQQRHRADPVLGPEQRAQIEWRGAQQPHLPALERDGREDEARGDGGEHEAG